MRRGEFIALLGGVAASLRFAARAQQQNRVRRIGALMTGTQTEDYFALVSEPVAQGFVASLARPGDNITGFSAYEFETGAKWVDLLKQMAPGLERIAVL